VRTGRYLLRRVVGAILTLFAVSVGTFALFFAIPADPGSLQCGRQCTPDQVRQVDANLGLDRPVYVQYAEFMRGIVAGRTIGHGIDAVRCPAPCLGYSFRTYEPVTSMIARAVPVTVSIVVGAVVLWLGVGLAIGALAAARRGTWIDRGAISLALLGASSQTFTIGLMLQAVLVYGLGWLPRPAYVSLADDPARWAVGLLLPWITIAAVSAAGYARLTRAQLVEVMTEDFIRTAWAKGLPGRSVLRHSLRAGITPIVTLTGLDVGQMLGGVVITETVFALPGVGTLAVQAVQDLNLPVVMGTVLLAAFCVVLVNLLVDVLYLVIDPRVRLG
jgi:peptide/nickel transport system permease protein